MKRVLKVKKRLWRKGKRSELEMCFSVLGSMDDRNYKKLTAIMNHSGLSFNVLLRIINKLIDRGLMEKIKNMNELDGFDSRTKFLYSITQKGMVLLLQYRRFRSELSL